MSPLAQNLDSVENFGCHHGFVLRGTSIFRESATNAELPQSKAFEALSQELFQMTATPSQSANILQDNCLSMNIAPNALLPEISNTSTEMPRAASPPSTAGMDSIFDFFNVDAATLGNDSGNLDGWLWSGPSLNDMFDVNLQQAGTANLSQSQ